jgi:Fe2+ transport system protein FeoA
MNNSPGGLLQTEEDQNTSSIWLDTLPKASRAEVVRLLCDPPTIRRLADLGIVVGAVLSLHRSAPLGGPVVVGVQGSQVALGRQLARQMMVRILP